MKKFKKKKIYYAINVESYIRITVFYIISFKDFNHFYQLYYSNHFTIITNFFNPNVKFTLKYCEHNYIKIKSFSFTNEIKLILFQF